MIRINTDSDLDLFAAMARTPTIEEIREHDADEHWMVTSNNASVARCSLWWQNTPRFDDERLGLIGHYAAETDDAASQIIDQALLRLGDEGCTLVVGPMDGSTWRRYRFVTERGTEPPFLLDLEHPATWPRQFERGGFDIFAHYISTLNPDLSRRHPREQEWRERVHKNGITLRPIDLADFTGELERIFDLSLESFAQNLLYTPLDRNAFLGMYLPFAEHVRADLVLMAERDANLEGFVFCIPDLLQARRGQPIDTVVLKTLAVHPRSAGEGLGSFLCAEAQRIAHESGYRRLIYAFMHEDNLSGRISTHYAHVIRRYALFARRLTGP